MFNANFSFVASASADAPARVTEYVTRSSSFYDCPMSPGMEAHEADMRAYEYTCDAPPPTKFNTLPRSYPRVRKSSMSPQGYNWAKGGPTTTVPSTSSLSCALREKRERRMSIGTLVNRFQNATFHEDEPTSYPFPSLLSSLVDYDEGYSEPALASPWDSAAPSVTSASDVSGPSTPTSTLSGPTSYFYSLGNHDTNFPSPPRLVHRDSYESTCSSSACGPTSEPALVPTTTSKSSSPPSTIPTQRCRFKRRHALTPLDLPAAHLSLLDMIAREERHPSEFDPFSSDEGSPWDSFSSTTRSQHEMALDAIGAKLVPFWGAGGSGDAPEAPSRDRRVRRSASPNANVTVASAGQAGRIGKRGSASAATNRGKSPDKVGGKLRVAKKVAGRGV